MSFTITNLGITESEDELFGHRNYTWRWQIESDDPKLGADVIVLDSRFIQKGWPLISASFSDPRAVLVKQRVAKKEDDPRIAFYTQTFSTDIKFPSGDAGSSTAPGTGGNGMTPANWPDNPLLQPPSIRGYYIREMEPIEEDMRGQPIVNTLGEPLLPPIEIARKYPAIAIGLNQATISEDFLALMQDAVNEAAWRGHEAGTVKSECEWHSEFDQQFGAYWHLDWVFTINHRGWNPTRFLNTSFNKRGPVVGGRYTLQAIRDYGQAVSVPQRIDKHGQPIGPPVVRAGTISEGSTTITLSPTTGIQSGDLVRCEGIPAGSTVASIDPDVSVTISDAATVAITGLDFTFTSPEHWLEFYLHRVMSFAGVPF